MLSLMYVTKFTSFCRIFKKILTTKNWFFFLPHGVYTARLNRPIPELASTALIRWRRRRKSHDGFTLLLSRHKQRIQYADSTKKV